MKTERRPDPMNTISLESNLREALELIGKGNFKSALEVYEKILEERSDLTEVYHNIGLILKRFGDSAGAECQYLRTIELKPEHVLPYGSLGNLLMSVGRFSEAEVSYRRFLFISPHSHDGWNNLGSLLFRLRRFSEAGDCYRRAIELAPNLAFAYLHLGNALRTYNCNIEAAERYRQSIFLDRNYPQAHNSLAILFADQRRFDEAITLLRKAIEMDVYLPQIHSNLLLYMTYMENVVPEMQLSESKIYAHQIKKYRGNCFKSWEFLDQSNVLKVGFVSGDFRSHSVAFFLENVISSLNKTNLHLIAYSNNSEEDNVTLRFKKIFNEYKTLVGKSDGEAAKLIRDDGVQLLIDLSGHTALNRLPVFAYRPAPIQASWLGYWATTGVDEIDCIIGDPYVIPPDEDHHFSEKIKRLPECYICFTQPEENVEVNELPAIENGYVTFGCFNNFSKINNAVIGLWAKILIAVDGSRLFLRAGQLADPHLISETVALFGSLGVQADRLSFEGTSTLKHYFQAYNRIDIALDPFPFPGVTTSLQSLWMGVPVLTKKGDRFVSHAGETIAHNSGQADWIAKDNVDYLSKAVRFSSDLKALAKLRAGLRPQLLASPLLNSENFARNFEKALFEMWTDYSNEK